MPWSQALWHAGCPPSKGQGEGERGRRKSCSAGKSEKGEYRAPEGAGGPEVEAATTSSDFNKIKMHPL